MKEYIINLFTGMENNGIEYAILHHIDNIFSKDDDIDFIVNVDNDKMLTYLITFCEENNTYLSGYYLIDIDIYRFDISYFDGTNLERIQLDCACNSIGNDLLKINTSELLENKIIARIEENLFYKISDTDEIDYYIRKKAYKNIDILLYINYFKALLPDISKGDILIKYQNYRQYFNSIRYKIKYYYNKLILSYFRLLNKPSFTVAFLGPDGSGKSTVIDSLKKVSLFNSTFYFHLKPIKQKHNHIAKVVTNPHKYPPYSIFKSYIKLIYFVFQYNINWLLNILPLKLKPSIIIFDRYYDDIIADNKRYRYGGSIYMVKLIRKLIPKPDLYFILTSNAEIINKRKQEVSIEELSKQIVRYNSLIDNNKYWGIDVNNTIVNINKEIVSIILIYKHKYNTRR